MLTFETANAVGEFVNTARKDARAERDEQAAYVARCRCYYLGQQWISQQAVPGGGYGRLTRQITDWTGRSGQIRATINRVTKHIIQVASATNPSRLDVDGVTTDRATGVGDAENADLLESIANIGIEGCGLLDAARTANHERTIAGDHGIGLMIEQEPMDVDIDGQAVRVTGTRLRAFDFDASRLTLDPHNQSRNLRDHEYVIYSDVLTVHGIKRMFGETFLRDNRIDEDKLRTVGQLMPVEIEFSTLSGGTLYQNYRQHSKSKGAVVHFMYCKAEDPRRFSKMYVVVESGEANPTVTNFDSPQSPYGGDGLPLMLLRGHRRPSMRRSISDVGMQLDDQDKLNMIASLYVQQVANYTGQGKWLLDRGWMGRRGDDADTINKVLRSNVLLSDGNTGTAKAPQYVSMPEPSQSLQFTMDSMEDSMREQAFRSEAHQGKLKTHQTNRNVQLAVELSELPLDDRVNDDVMEYERFISMLTGTGIIAVKHADPSILSSLSGVGFGAEELARAAAFNPYQLPAKVKLRHQGLRYRSRSSREQQLYDMANSQIIDGRTVRRIMADELEMPVSDVDKQVIRFCRSVAERVMYGEQFFIFPLGDRVDVMLEELTRAMTSGSARHIEGGIERLAAAIQMQEQAIAQQAMAAQGAPEQQAGPGDTLNLADIMAQAG